MFTFCFTYTLHFIACWLEILFFLVWPLLPTHCRCRRLLLHLITHMDIYTHTHSVGLLWTRDRPVAETTWHHTQHSRNRHPCPRREFFFLPVRGFFPLIHFFCTVFRSFRPSCHFTFHSTVLITNTTQTSMPPVGFFFCLSGVFPLWYIFVLFNPLFFVLHVTYVPCYCPSTTNTTQTSIYSNPRS
jgi:hypothetical protein